MAGGCVGFGTGVAIATSTVTGPWAIVIGAGAGLVCAGASLAASSVHENSCYPACEVVPTIGSATLPPVPPSPGNFGILAHGFVMTRG